MPADERRRRAEGLKAIVTSRDPGDWIDEQIADIRKKARGHAASAVEQR
jgi:trehalose 6-phosphate synthase